MAFSKKGYLGEGRRFEFSQTKTVYPAQEYFYKRDNEKMI